MNRGLHFEAIADDARIQQDLFYALLSESRHFFRIEVSEIFSIPCPFMQNSGPTQSGLGSFKNQELKVNLVIMHRVSPLFIVIADISIGGQAPRTTFSFFHKLIEK